MSPLASTPSASWLPVDSTELAAAAYEALAPYYDRFMSGCRYEAWLDAIEAWALAHGLRGRRLLDAACGTGRSFEPMLRRGYEVTGFDLSPAMVAEANRRAAGRATLIVADMRSLSWNSQFDLVTCVDDAINYLLTDEDLTSALAGMRHALRPGGILVFDTNSVATYRTTFAQQFDVVSGNWRFQWRGETVPSFVAGGIASATIEVTAGASRTSSWHVQRHWSVSELRAACEAVGLHHVSFRGQLPGCRLEGDPDEERHTKVLCLAARPAQGGGTP
jgi:SAM-dependent methyltransferase